ncbi:MAG: DUF2334 domain-containing protein [Candidatus Hodarchaeota archaeon]
MHAYVSHCVNFVKLQNRWRLSNKHFCTVISFFVLVTTLFLTLPGYAPSTEGNGKAGKVAVVLGKALFYDVPMQQVQRLLEHEGLRFDVAMDVDLSHEFRRYNAIIVIGASQPILNPSQQEALLRVVEDGTSLIWIGDCLTDSLYHLFGIREASSSENLQKITRIDYGEFSTKIFNESLYAVETSGASTEGFFADDTNLKIAPAETAYRRHSGSGLTCYFAYDVYSWWGADLDIPWLRAYRLKLALDSVLSEHLMIRLLPYPRNLKSVFISRIEDVDPLHNSEEWLSRAYRYLDYYAAKNAPLTVALIPTYLDPSVGLNVGLEADSASMLRRWLSDVVMRGGSLVEHGFTHQYGTWKTGVTPEFFDSERNRWLTLEKQKTRLALGVEQIESNLGVRVKGFEAPHYVANHDTYVALNMLNFKYVTHNSDTPYLDRYGLAGELINVPETLQFIPLNPKKDVEKKMRFNMDMLYNMSGVMLFFNHLFDDEAVEIGERLLDYASTKSSMWYTSTNELADFWQQRLNAYDKMNVESGERIKITLGSSSKVGLTIALNGEMEIKSVNVNGDPWSVFDVNHVILPALPNPANTIIIDLVNAEENINMVYGWFTTFLSVISSTILYRKLKRNKMN